MSMCADVYAVTEADIARLMTDASYFAEVTAYDNNSLPRFSLEKAWHGIFYLLTGEAWDASGPLGLISSGGAEIPESDSGYGAARVLSPDEVVQFCAALEPIDEQLYWSRFDPAVMTEEGIYPEIWDEPETDLREEYVMYFQGLKEIALKAAASGRGLMVTLG